MKILIVDNNINPLWWGAADLARYALKTPDATVFVRRAPQEDLPAFDTPFDRVIISGSKTSALDPAPWTHVLEEHIRHWVDRGTPILGVCYGHQMIARALGGMGAVGRAAEAEIGWTDIQVLEPFCGLKGRFFTFSSHCDEVMQIPRGARLLARSKRCAHQAYRLDGKLVLGIQFHPEKNLLNAEATFNAYRQNGRNPKEFLEPQSGKKLYDPEIAEKIFGSFLAGKI